MDGNRKPIAVAAAPSKAGPIAGPFAQLRFLSALLLLMAAAGLIGMMHWLAPRLVGEKADRADARVRDLIEAASTGRALPGDDDLGGLLTLLALSIVAALVPWFGHAPVAISASLSFLALGVPAAALRAASRGDEVETIEETPAWVLLWQRPQSPPPPPPERPRAVAIIGGGFSGTMLAIHLAKAEGVRVTLIERRETPARGIAYSTTNESHLLNVRAEKMSAWPGDPGHFARWLGERGLGTPADFAPRATYGRYLDQQLRHARADAGLRLKLVSAEARRIDFQWENRRILLDDGRQVDADMVVLATGNAPPPALPAFAGLPLYLYAADPWQDGLADGLGRDDVVLLVGTGLTMVDAAIGLVDAGFEGRIIALSRRGLLPRAHAATLAAPPVGELPHLPLSRLLAALRARAADIGWRTAMDELRPATQKIWGAMDDEERRRFLRHARPWWDVHRHRIAPEVAARLDALRDSGRLEVVAGTILGADVSRGQVAVRVRKRGTDEIRRIEAARVVNCAGSDGDPRHSEDPLIRSLVASGAISADAQGLGIDTGSHGEAIGADGSPTPGLFALGPLARGRLWEATAVPELRAEAAAMAAQIAAGVETSASPKWAVIAPSR